MVQSVALWLKRLSGLAENDEGMAIRKCSGVHTGYRDVAFSCLSCSVFELEFDMCFHSSNLGLGIPEL